MLRWILENRRGVTGMSQVFDSQVLFNNKCTADKEMSFLQRKQTGSFYTASKLALQMMSDLIESLPKEKRTILYELRFLEPCVGEGSFVFAYLEIVQKLGFSKEQLKRLFNNIYVCDSNPLILEVYSNKLREVASNHFDIYLDDEYFAKHIGGSLLFDVTTEEPQYISIGKVFTSFTENSFDIVVTNPPYKNLKAERIHYPTSELHQADKIRYAQITKNAKKILQHSIKGVNNLYKYFVEEIIERYATKDAIVSLLIPSSILGDKTCEPLRKRIFDTSSVKSIKTISESSNVVDAQQALCAILLHKGKSNDTIEIVQNYGSAQSKKIAIEASKVIDVSLGYAILVLEPTEYDKLQKLKSFPKIKDLEFLTNRRGELDLTANKEKIMAQPTEYTLLRGRNIGFFELVGMPSEEYVDPSFVEASTKREYIGAERLVCQQIANMSKGRRLTFAIAPKNLVLGNSCNFIALKDNVHEIDVYFLLGILNSNIMNWYFKIQSSNNHINNYEIDTFPVPINFDKKQEISTLVQEYLGDPSRKALLDRVDLLVNEAFGVLEGDFDSLPSTTDFDKKVILAISKRNEHLSRGEVLNHTTFKLSALDLEMVRSVPQGGNWKSIPQATVAKSKRLTKITQTGGRTTLYGRIDYSKPSYTITTYFSRPGNGTYIHPIHDRVLTVREAARFQAFPDDYYFCGNKTQLLNQVGNAVPPLFAYQIAKQIIGIIDCKTAVDLFCGAGGMTLGFKQAGIKSVLATDIEESACLTLKANNPEIPVLCGDVTHNDVKSKIIEISLKEGVDIICGGAPCQGFSMAGNRLSDDPRNKLFKDFIEIIKFVQPKVVVFENVEGLLTFQGGSTYRLIHDMFSEIGYVTEGRLLQTQLYGVPQKRKRVILICVRKDLSVCPQDLYPEPVTLNENSQINAYMAISDLENVQCGDNERYENSEYSAFVAVLRGEIAPSDFLDTLSKSDEPCTPTENVQMSLF